MLAVYFSHDIKRRGYVKICCIGLAENPLKYKNVEVDSAYLRRQYIYLF